MRKSYGCKRDPSTALLYANYSGKKIKLHPFLYVFTEKRHFFLSIISI